MDFIFSVIFWSDKCVVCVFDKESFFVGVFNFVVVFNEVFWRIISVNMYLDKVILEKIEEVVIIFIVLFFVFCYLV